MGHASVGAPLPSGGALFARIGAALFAILVPVFLLLAQLKSGDQAIKGWKDYHRIDIVVLILAVVTVVCIVASLRSVAPVLPTIAAALAFAMFGLVLGFPMEFASQAGDSANVKIGIGAVLAFLSALLSGILSIWVAAVTKPAADGGLIGAGRGASALNRQPAAPTGVPQQPAQAASGAAPGWYPDPNGVARLRYFDGINWTDQTGN